MLVGSVIISLFIILVFRSQEVECRERVHCIQGCRADFPSGGECVPAINSNFNLSMYWYKNATSTSWKNCEADADHWISQVQSQVRERCTILSSIFFLCFTACVELIRICTGTRVQIFGLSVVEWSTAMCWYVPLALSWILALPLRRGSRRVNLIPR